jgi:hypothetical protein
MRPQNSIARARLDANLRKYKLGSATLLADALGVSIPTLHRILHERGEQIVRLGTTKYARYALRRSLRGITKPTSVYMIDAQGHGSSCGAIDLLAPEGSLFDLSNLGWPVDAEHASGVWDGLPYPLYDMRPQGYLGRNFARQIAADLDVPPDPEKWSDDNILFVLSRRGADTSGNLIIGDYAYHLWLQEVALSEPAIPQDQQAIQYAQLAAEAVRFVGGGSSAGGEFPKFTAKRALAQSATPHVIVKFSGADASVPVIRWSDLLVCEHLALQAISGNTEFAAATSRIIQSEGRTFLEVERFDRCGEFGRLPLISLASLDAAFIGLGSGDWTVLLDQLYKLSMIPESLLFDVQVLWWFGRLIGNNDMHLGNLSFQLDTKSHEKSTLCLAPVYDMLPMQYAPLSGGEVPPSQFMPALPSPNQIAAWKIAYTAAVFFWESAIKDGRISVSFREICQTNLLQLNKLKPLVK